MAARLNPRNAESTRQKIQVTQLINALQNHALAKGGRKGKGEMSATRIDAAKFLINKAMPNPPEDKNLNLQGELKVELLSFADSQTS